MSQPSRREVLTVAAVTVTLPMLQTALGGIRSAAAAAPKPKAPAAETAGWFSSKIKAANLKDNEFTSIDGHLVVLSRSGKTVTALSNTCTHKGCEIKPKAGQKILACKCHGAEFTLEGAINPAAAKKPSKEPLPHYAIRLAADGTIEIDPGQKVAKTDNSFSITIE